MNKDLLFVLKELSEQNKPSVIVTLVNIKGSAPQELGAKIVVCKEGLRFGTIGGGKLELRAIEVALELLEGNDLHLFCEWNLQKDIGMTCGGVVNLYFEKQKGCSPWSIAVFGAGHIAQELVPLLTKLDCMITWADPRTEWLNKQPDHYRLKKICTEDMAAVLKELPANSFVVSITMGHAFDLAIVKEALTYFDFPYVGSIGSPIKAKALRSDLTASGLSQEKIQKLICPIGLDIGENQPMEIVISILAQLLEKRDRLKQAAI